MRFDHRFVFRVFLVVLLGTIILWLFAWHYDIGSASQWFLLLWFICPIVLAILLAMTIVMSLFGGHDKKDVTKPRLALYAVLLIIAVAFSAIMIRTLFTGIP